MVRSISIFLLLIFGTASLHAEDLAVSTVKDREYVNKLSRSTPSIYKLTAKTGVVYKIQTAIGYVTTIELPDEALKVFLGDQDLFVVEVYGSQVIVKPGTDYMDARSNLTIYTQNTRLSFDVSVGAPETADFVLDFRYPGDESIVDNAFNKKLDEKKGELEAAYQEKLKDEDRNVKALAQARFEDALKRGANIRRLQISKLKDNIQLDLVSLSEIGNRYYLRFKIMNRLQTEYVVERIVLARDTKEGLRPIEFSQNIEKTVPKGSYQYGIVGFDKVILNKDEKFVLRLYEKDKADPIEISQVPLEV